MASVERGGVSSGVEVGAGVGEVETVCGEGVGEVVGVILIVESSKIPGVGAASVYVSGSSDDSCQLSPFIESPKLADWSSV